MLIKMLKSLFYSLFGNIIWQSPPWLSYLHKQAKPSSKSLWITLISLFTLCAIAVYSYHYYMHLPKPLYVTAKITGPEILAKGAPPSPLMIDFGIKNPDFVPQSVAPLSMIGKDVKSNITMSPILPGNWRWNNENQLVFQPSGHWSPHQTYNINFSTKLFTSHTHIKKLDYSFTTQSFKIDISDLKLYQDPLDAKTRKVVATIDFNYPVDSANFENKIILQSQDLKSSKKINYKFSLTFDEYKRTAYLHSEPIPLSNEARYLELKIDSCTKTLLIPDTNSYFKILNSATQIVRNDKDRPEQVLTIESSLGVTDKELNKAIHVYLLPQNNPDTSDHDKKYNWTNPGEVSNKILALSTPVTLYPLPTEHNYSSTHSYQFTAPESRFLYVKIDPAIHGFGDFKLTNQYTNVLSVPEFPREITFLHKGSLLALSSEKKLSVVSRGLPAVKFQIARVFPDAIQHLITQTYGNFNNPQFTNPQFNQDNISQIATEIQSFKAEVPDKDHYTALDLDKHLTKNSLGVFLIKAVGWDEDKGEETDPNNSRLILITDLSLIVKDSNNGNHDVFVHSISKGMPVADIKVSVLGKNGLPILTAVSDANGHVNFPSLQDFILDREPIVYVAKQGDDVSFIPYNNFERQLNYSRFDVGGVYTNDQDIKTLSAYVFTDRGIYRPGDDAHIGIIIKHTFAKSQPAGLPIQVIVTDPRGIEIQNEKMKLNDSGFLTFDIKSSTNSLTGQYTVSVYIVKDNHASNLLGTANFNVAEFLPDRMHITSHFSASNEGWLSPQDLKVNVGLWNLYGAPSINRNISAKMVLAPKAIRFNAYEHYTFMDPLFDPNKPPKVTSETLSDTITNDKGNATFDLNLSRFEKATYQLTVYIEGFEAEGGRSVATQLSALINPLDYLIGNKPDGDLHYIHQNTLRHINFIAIDNKLKQIDKSNLTLQLFSLHPISTLVKNQDGTYQYKSITQTNLMNSTPFSINDKGTDYQLPTNKIGDFAIVVLDQYNTELSRLTYTVVGTSQQAINKDAQLNINLNKKKYHSDEDIELQINAPYTGAGLITLERDKIYAYNWFKTDMQNSVQKIHIPNSFEGNGYVNVTFIRDWNSPEIFINPLSFSVIPFNVNHDNRAIHIDLRTAALIKPGEMLPITYSSNNPGKIVIFAVDEGILQVSDYLTPDPLAFFFQKNALEVITQQTADQILPKFIAERELSSVGGDTSTLSQLKNINPFKRKTDKPVVYWSGMIDTDSQQRTVNYQIPDYYNGKLRVMAVAVSNDAVGSSNTSTEVRGDFIINPNIPTFVSPNDIFEITASIANNIKNSGKEAPIDVTINTSQSLQVIGNSKQTLNITEGQEQTVRFKIKALNSLGSAKIRLNTSLNNKMSHIVSTLSIRPASPYITNILTGTFQDKTTSISIDKKFYSEYRNVEAMVSTNPLNLIIGLQRYLDNFPYGCTEQIISKAFPALIMSTRTDLINLQNPRASEIEKEKIKSTLQVLAQRQLTDGSFSYWPIISDYSNNHFASVYAVHFLTEARALGFSIPNEIMQNGLRFLKELATKDISTFDEARLQAYAIYLLTRNEIVTTNYLTHLQLYLQKNPAFKWHEDITSIYMAATYSLLKNDVEAKHLLTKFTSQDINSFTDFYDANIATAQYLYLLSLHFPEQLTKHSNDLIMPLVKAMNDNDINTLLSSYISLAFNAYINATQSKFNKPDFTIETVLSSKETKTNPDHKLLSERLIIAENVNKLIIHNPSKSNYFYQLTQAGFETKTPNFIIKQGLEIYREYRDDNTVVDHIELGKEIEVHIYIRALNNAYLNNIVIMDLLPGGFEVIRDSVHADNIDYFDVREDRVLFFGSIGPDSKEIIYRIKAINSGEYFVSPIYANSMYNPTIQARGTSGKFVINHYQ